MGLRLSNETADVACAAVTPLLDDGYLRIYTGVRPATGDTAITVQVLLAELRFGATAFAASSNGVALANAMTGEDACLATGTASWFRALKSDGTSPVYDGTVGTSGADLNLNSVSLVTGYALSISSLQYRQPKA